MHTNLLTVSVALHTGGRNIVIAVCRAICNRSSKQSTRGQGGGDGGRVCFWRACDKKLAPNRRSRSIAGVRARGGGQGDAHNVAVSSFPLIF